MTLPRPLQLASYFVALILSGWLTASCKKQPASQALDTSASGPSSSKARYLMHAPRGPQTKPKRTFDDFKRAFPGVFTQVKDQALNQVMSIDQLATGESVLYVNNGEASFPAASLDGEEKFIWQDIVVNNPTEPLKLLQTLLAYKTPANLTDAKDGGLSESGPHFLRKFKNKDRYTPIPLKDVIYLPTGILLRVDNQFFDESGRARFQYVNVAPGVWRLEGSFYNGFACSGSVIWNQGNQYYVVTQQFGQTQVSSWVLDGESLTLEKDKLETSLPSAVRQALKPCSFNRPEDVQKKIASLSYQPDSRVVTPGAIEAFVWGKDYPTGTKVTYDNSVWEVLESNPNSEFKSYTFLTVSRTTAEDKGETRAQIYSLTDFGDGREFYQVGRTSDYLQEMATYIHHLSDERIKATDLHEYTDLARKKLQVAEAKANTVGAGFGQWYKPVTQIGVNAVSDLLANKRLGAAMKTLGIATPAGKSVNMLVTTADVSIKQRIAALMTVTLVEGLSVSSQAIIARMEKGESFAQASQFAVGTTTQTGGMYGLRAFSGATPTKIDDFVFNLGSGVLMRMRKLNVEKALGYQNQNEYLNLGAGGVQALAQVIAINVGAGPGVVGSIGKAGVLFSEWLSGRDYSGVMVGGFIEIGTELLVKHPVLRPFLNTLAGQVSAMVQIGDAYHTESKRGQILDRLRQNRIEQVKAVNAIVYVLKNYPEKFERLDAVGKSLVLMTAADPFAKIRQHWQVSYPELP